MKYWRGFLVAGVLGVIAWALLSFANAHSALVDMFYPYVTRMIQDSFAVWTGAVEFNLWQVLLVLLALLVLVTVVLMLLLRWNPVQLLGWILAVVMLVFLLHTGLYGLNDYAGSIADDVQLEVTDYTVSQLFQAAAYYRDQANALAGQTARDENGLAEFPEFSELTSAAPGGFRDLVYEQGRAVFAGSTVPVKELGWPELFATVGIASIHIPITGEASVNPQVPDVGLPFLICFEMSHRMSISYDEDAYFAAYLACISSPDVNFRYSGYVMAYRACLDVLTSLPTETTGNAMLTLVTGVSPEVQQDLDAYNAFFRLNRDADNVNRMEYLDNLGLQLSGFLQNLTGTNIQTGYRTDFCDLLVSWHLQEIVLPVYTPSEDDRFDPFENPDAYRDAPAAVAG